MRAYDLSQLIAAVAELPPLDVPETVQAELVRWAGDNDNLLSVRSVYALIRLGHFPAHSELIASKLGLSRAENGKWDWEADLPGQMEWAPLGVVLLYSMYSEAFTPAVCSVFADGRWFSGQDSVGALEQLVLEGAADLNDELREALVARVKARNSSRFSDPSILQQVGVLAPVRFAAEEWTNTSQDWMEDSRAALADVLGSISNDLLLLSPGLRQRAADHLIALTGDGSYSVRRAAYRGLGRILPIALELLCGTLVQSRNVADRLRAVEAWVWLPPFSFSPATREAAHRLAARSDYWQPDTERYCRLLKGDINKLVREAVRSASASRHRRQCGEGYLLQLITASRTRKALPLGFWKIANALARAGDDEALSRLRKHLAHGGMAPSTHYLLSRIAKDLEKNWEKATKAWPQSVPAVPGRREQVEGKLAAEEQYGDVQGTIWHLAAKSQEDGQGWGGTVRTRGDAFYGLAAAFGRTCALLLQDGRVGNVYVIGVSPDGFATFKGSGAYPSGGATGA
jgi:hypothetical protein